MTPSYWSMNGVSQSMCYTATNPIHFIQYQCCTSNTNLLSFTDQWDNDWPVWHRLNFDYMMSHNTEMNLYTLFSLTQNRVPFIVHLYTQTIFRKKIITCLHQKVMSVLLYWTCINIETHSIERPCPKAILLLIRLAWWMCVALLRHLEALLRRANLQLLYN